MIDEYTSKNLKKSIGFTSLGQLKYLSALQYMDFILVIVQVDYLRHQVLK